MLALIDSAFASRFNGHPCESPRDDIVVTRAWTTDYVKDLRVLPCQHEERFLLESAIAVAQKPPALRGVTVTPQQEKFHACFL